MFYACVYVRDMFSSRERHKMSIVAVSLLSGVLLVLNHARAGFVITNRRIFLITTRVLGNVSFNFIIKKIN